MERWRRRKYYFHLFPKTCKNMTWGKPNRLYIQYHHFEWNCQTNMPDCIPVYMQTQYFHRKGRDPYVSSGTSGNPYPAKTKICPLNNLNTSQKNKPKSASVFFTSLFFLPLFLCFSTLPPWFQFLSTLLHTVFPFFSSSFFLRFFFLLHFFSFSKNQNLYMFIGRVTYE